ncbi:hypothetical protein ACIRQP_42030 [Streptomyces sp. NPDC102274]|uniref:hypothetical protein n=1 Tax=Streptomyces sp. NPDC102274 TaxID=3366151 RepID=UPI0037F200DA
MLIHLGLQGRLHQMLGQLGQQPALAHQPQPLAADLLRRERGQLLQQFGGQTVRRHRHRLHVGTLSAITSRGKRHAINSPDQVTRRRTHGAHSFVEINTSFMTLPALSLNIP